ncbi:MAG: TRAP transporter large permease subunit, partial [Hyphomicrobiales bacterium]|nr:TRAP transporter large permease subunit [Hyphomicrobiales bacterium]
GYFVLGALMDELAMILLTVPIVFPAMTQLGFDPVWFGVIVVMVVELGLITPPIGMNVFVIKGMAPDVKLSDIYRGVIPFVAAQILLIIIVFLIPAIILWLPQTAKMFR